MGCLEPFLSIIVPIYNVPERYLRKCIESLINQTFKDIEILLIDDGSTDNSSLICDEYSASNENITTIHKENGGLSSARNKGVREASGKYIMFVDGDDWINPESCEVLHNCFNNNDVDLIMFCMSKDYEESTTPYLYFLKENYIYKDDEIKWLQSQVLNYNSNIATVTTKLIKRELLISNNVFHNEQLKQGAEGIVFNIDLFGTVRSAVFIKKYLYHYLYNESSISASYNEKNVYLVLDCFKEIQNRISNLQNSQELMVSYRNRLVYAIVSAVISGFFNPSNPDRYRDKKRKCNEYLNYSIVDDALKNADLSGMTKSRKIVVNLIKHRSYVMIYILGSLRKWQKSHS